MADHLAGDLYVADPGEDPILALPSVSIRKAAPVGRLSFRARPDLLGEAGAAFGAELPQKPLSATAGAGRAALWMGPDEWTMLCPEAEAGAVFDALETKLSGKPHALVNISDRSDAVIVSGEKSVWLLNSGLFLDLGLTAFPVGTITRTVFHKAPVMLWRIGEDCFVVEAWGSFLDYVTGLLAEAARELEAA